MTWIVGDITGVYNDVHQVFVRRSIPGKQYSEFRHMAMCCGDRLFAWPGFKRITPEERIFRSDYETLITIRAQKPEAQG
jgi:hypothetical protein